LSALPHSIDAKWKSVRIPIDSIIPTALVFSDSLNGYFCGYKDYSRSDPNVLGISEGKIFYFRTTNGGRTWSIVDFQGLFVDSTFSTNVNYYTHRVWGVGERDIFAFPNYALLRYNHIKDPTAYLFTTDNGNQWHNKLHYRDSTELIQPHELMSMINKNEMIRLISAPIKNVKNNYWQFYDSLQHRLIYDSILTTGIGLYYSIDGGYTFPYLRMDSIFYTALDWDQLSDIDTISQTARINLESTVLHFSWSDPFHWIVFIGGGPDDKPHRYSGLNMLYTSNGGKSWSLYSYSIPGFENDKEIGGYPRIIKGTSHLYYATGPGGIWSGDGPRIHSEYSGFQSLHNVSFLYSSDYGKTWTMNNSYGNQRRGFEASDIGDIWMTVTQSPTQISGKYPANTIVHSTDNGLTWFEDDTTLRVFEQPLDGRILTFIDKNHGWLAAQTMDINATYIFYYETDTKNSVEYNSYTGYYGLHYTLYPNPARETARLSMYKYLTLKDVSVYNVFGSEVPLGYRIDGSDIELDVRDLPIGHYTLRVKHNWGISVIPLVVMR
jgi:hypothetical protein